jgi:mannose-6-phosphate isomerase-like protein (cupin superfamily)
MNRLWVALLLAAMPLAGTGLAAGANAVDISGAEIDKALQRTATDPESDQPLRVVNIENQFNLGISIVHRARTSNRPIDPATARRDITEIFHFISGTGTLITGGTLLKPQQIGPNPVSGAGVQGTRIRNGHIRAVGPGDVVVVPPNTPVQFTEISSGELVYLVVKVDPHKVLTATR